MHTTPYWMMELYNLISHFSLSFLLNHILFITNLIIFISFFYLIFILFCMRRWNYIIWDEWLLWREKYEISEGYHVRRGRFSWIQYQKGKFTTTDMVHHHRLHRHQHQEVLFCNWGSSPLVEWVPFLLQICHRVHDWQIWKRLWSSCEIIRQPPLEEKRENDRENDGKSVHGSCVE